MLIPIFEQGRVIHRHFMEHDICAKTLYAWFFFFGFFYFSTKKYILMVCIFTAYFITDVPLDFFPFYLFLNFLNIHCRACQINAFAY